MIDSVVDVPCRSSNPTHKHTNLSTPTTHHHHHKPKPGRQRHRGRRGHRALRRDGQPLRAQPHHRPHGLQGPPRPRRHRAHRRPPHGACLVGVGGCVCINSTGLIRLSNASRSTNQHTPTYTPANPSTPTYQSTTTTGVPRGPHHRGLRRRGRLLHHLPPRGDQPHRPLPPGTYLVVVLRRFGALAACRLIACVASYVGDGNALPVSDPNDTTESPLFETGS